MQVHLAASTGSPVQLQYPFKEALLSCPETGHERAAALKPLFERCCSCNPEDRPPVWQVHQCLQHALLVSGADGLHQQHCYRPSNGTRGCRATYFGQLTWTVVLTCCMA